MKTSDEREIALDLMRASSASFYKAAVYIRNHPWIEFAGLMNAYIDACSQAHRSGIDFSECHGHSGQTLPMEGHQVDYVREKLGCIFNGQIA